MRAVTLKAHKSLRDCVYDAEREEFLVTFRDGRMYRFPRGLLPEDDRTEILSVQVGHDGSAFVVRQRSGKSFEVPWDFVLHHLEPGYPYFKGGSSQRLLEKNMAVRVSPKLRELRQEKGVTAHEVPRRAGVQRANNTRIENGEQFPTLDNLPPLSGRFG